MNRLALSLLTLAVGPIVFASAVFAQVAPTISRDDVIKTFTAPPSASAAPTPAPRSHKAPCNPNEFFRDETGELVQRKCDTMGFDLGDGDDDSTPPPAVASNTHVPAKIRHHRNLASLSLPAPALPNDPNFNLKLTFNTDSSELTPVGAANATEFARAIQGPQLAARRFVIEGYADASGDPTYNVALSQRRADTARAFLVKAGVDPSRIESRGLGSVLARPDLPYDEENRRVIAREIR